MSLSGTSSGSGISSGGASQKLKSLFTSSSPSSSTGAQSLAGSEEEYLKQQGKEAERQKRKEDYDRLGLGDRTKGVNSSGGGGFGGVGMKMN